VKDEKTTKSSAKGRKKKGRNSYQTSAKKVQNNASSRTPGYSVNLLEISTAPSALDSAPHSSSPQLDIVSPLFSITWQDFCPSFMYSHDSLMD
jgi:hypothetical protein